ncbi:small RNA degrading nuclease 1-like isoform X1 [Coffea eugenioides]|uniref:Small RNA degrading nuclease 1-like n=2 Tax=Coffea TaxID=13442 RepID=A0A6P6TJR9_COFAR|nr:small RNA degrading nuclease 1-like isoform X1 [Coffea arabica]XP_027153160.1 small RNA degrading nuclease 1-like isoform X1 [Coffea eugenioides]
MDEMLSSVKKEVLVEMVKLAQKRGMKGSKGGWKEFLNFYDKKIGASLSDPSRRPLDTLLAFLKTFTQDDDLKFFEKLLECHSNRDAVYQFQKTSPDAESPEQRLVRLTLEHPQYPIDYSFPSHEEGWLVMKRTKKSKTMTSTAMVAVDCEMVLCENETEALVRVCVVDRNLQVKLNEFVKPSKAVVDYRTEITGIAAKDLDGATCSLSDIQKSMKKLLSHGTILVGHSLNNDLRALKLDHARVIDTSYIFKHGDGPSSRRLSLSNLCKSILGYELRKGQNPHNCLDDACAAMKLVLANIERGVGNVIPLVHEDAQEADLAKLLVHRIPVNVHSEDLHEVIPGDFTIEMKANKKAKGSKYSVFAIFKNQQEANEAFDCIDGYLDKDTSGRSQKSISFHLNRGIVGSFCVRKMAKDSPGVITSKKRSFEPEEALTESKKLHTDQECRIVEESRACTEQCQSRLEEIERLKQELSQRDREISSLNKIIVALTRKQGL